MVILTLSIFSCCGHILFLVNFISETVIINPFFWQENSVISSNTNLAVYGQGLLKLTGHGDAIKAQRLSLSLFYNITVRQIYVFFVHFNYELYE